MRRYPEYKESGVDWLGEVPSHWQAFSLKRAVEGCVNGIWGTEPDGKNDITVLRVADFDRNSLKISDKKLTVRSILPQERVNKMLKKGDLLIEKSGGGEKTLVGCTVLFDKNYDAVTSNFVAKMTPKSGFDSGFLNYAFSHLYSLNVNYMSINQTTGIQNLDSYLYLKNYFCFPDLEEQVKITNYLDRETTRIDNLITEKQTFIKLLKEKRQALISQVMTKGLDPNVKMKDSGIEWIGEVPEHWEICKISYRYEILLGKMLDEKKITGDHLNYYLRNTDVQWDKINIENLPQMDFKSEEIDRYQVRKGDLLVCEGGEIGRCAVWDRDKPCFYQKALHRVRPYSQKNDCTRFLFYVISDAVNQERFVSRANKATIAHLPAESFRQYRFAFPNYDEQLEIAEYLDGKKRKFDQLLKETEKSVRLLFEHRSALISTAVTGKVDVRSEAQTSLDQPHTQESAHA